MGDFETAEGRPSVDGAFRDARSGATYDDVDPATEEVPGAVADAGGAGIEGDESLETETIGLPA